MKDVYVKLKGSDRAIKKEAVSVEFMDLGKGVLHIITKDWNYYYSLEMIESCAVSNDY